MNKKLILVFLAGWALALILPPTKLLGYVRGGSSS
jgi:hypothetical protein